jgi:hypothetical protein
LGQIAYENYVLKASLRDREDGWTNIIFPHIGHASWDMEILKEVYYLYKKLR